MAKPNAARIPIFIATSVLALSFSSAQADPRNMTGAQITTSNTVPRANSGAEGTDWRGPVTRTGSVELPSSREKLRFSYPGAPGPRRQEPRQLASLETPDLSPKPLQLWPATAPKIPDTTDRNLTADVTPATALFPEEHGLASWYGEQFDGHLTANGEVFDMDAMTAAHPSLPMPSLVEVTNAETGRTVVVRVNDRGPFSGSRIIDLSHRAADELGLVEQGTAPVKVRYVGPASDMMLAAGPVRQAAFELDTNPLDEIEPAPAETRAPPHPNLYDKELLGGQEPSLGVPDPGMQIPTPKRLTPDTPVRMASGSSEPPVKATLATYTPNDSKPPVFGPQVYVQIGSFADIGNAQNLTTKVTGRFATDIEEARVKGADYFRVLVGPYSTREAADQARAELKSAGIRDGFMVLR